MHSSSNPKHDKAERERVLETPAKAEATERTDRVSVGTDALRDDEMAYSMPCTD